VLGYRTDDRATQLSLAVYNYHLLCRPHHLSRHQSFPSLSNLAWVCSLLQLPESKVKS
jgi:hypothetical protein